jgi:hypothetical protein
MLRFSKLAVLANYSTPLNVVVSTVLANQEIQRDKDTPDKEESSYPLIGILH